MIAWLNENAPALQVLLGVLTAMVWLAYLQLLVSSLRLQRRPLVLINTGAGRGIRQACFLSNLGMEPIYLMDLAIRVKAGDRVGIAAITDCDPGSDGGATDRSNATNQGPMDSGAMRDVGTFETLIGRALDEMSDAKLEDVVRLDLVAVFTVAAQDKICAAKRSFTIGDGDPPALVPDSVRARQIVGWRQRWRLRRWLEARRQGRPEEGGLP